MFKNNYKKIIYLLLVICMFFSFKTEVNAAKTCFDGKNITHAICKYKRSKVSSRYNEDTLIITYKDNTIEYEYDIDGKNLLPDRTYEVNVTNMNYVKRSNLFSGKSKIDYIEDDSRTIRDDECSDIIFISEKYGEDRGKITTGIGIAFTAGELACLENDLNCESYEDDINIGNLRDYLWILERNPYYECSESDVSEEIKDNGTTTYIVSEDGKKIGNGTYYNISDGTNTGEAPTSSNLETDGVCCSDLTGTIVEDVKDSIACSEKNGNANTVFYWKKIYAGKDANGNYVDANGEPLVITSENTCYAAGARFKKSNTNETTESLIKYEEFLAKNINVNFEDVKVECDDFKVPRYIWNIIIIIAPFLVVIFGSIDFFKVVVASDESARKTMKKNFPKRILAFVLLILIPVLIKVLFKMFGDNGKMVETLNCIVNGK